MGRGHTPYGYRIENGKALVDEGQAARIRKLCEGYISGMGLTAAAGSAGIEVSHAGAMRIMLNRHYAGDDFYPRLLAPETVKAVEEERKRRAKLLGRENKPKTHKPAKPPVTGFVMGGAERHYEDPFEQAAYVYSLVREEELDGNGHRDPGKAESGNRKNK